MSAISQVFLNMIGLFSPSSNTSNPQVSSPSSASTSPLAVAGRQRPTEVSTSYFPNETSGTRRSSASSSGSDSTASPLTTPGNTAAHPLDVMSREYVAPVGELDVAAQLAKEPQRWALHGYIKRQATSTRTVPVEDAETKAKKLAAAKAELLALAGKA